MNWNLTPCNKLPGQGLTDMGYPWYPPSLYRAISYASSLGVPVYVTENGIPSSEDDDCRTQWINGYLAQVQPNSVPPPSRICLMPVMTCVMRPCIQRLHLHAA